MIGWRGLGPGRAYGVGAPSTLRGCPFAYIKPLRNPYGGSHGLLERDIFDLFLPEFDKPWDSFCDDFSQALACVGDSPIPSQIPDSQPHFDSKVEVTPLSVVNGPMADLVARVAAEVAARFAATKKNKNRREADRALKASQKGTGAMKWLPFMSSFVLEKMCGLIKTGVKTDKGFKEVHLADVAKGLYEHHGVSACSTQVYNHMRKWRQRWLTISRLRDLSRAQWCENTKCIILEGEHYYGHDHPKDVEYLNVPIGNYDEMHTIFSFSLASGKSLTVNLDGPPEKVADAPEKATVGKRKRGAFAGDELVAFTYMTVAVMDVEHAIRDNKPTNMHPGMYNAVMNMLGFAKDDLMAALSHLVNHKAQGCSFVGMIEPRHVPLQGVVVPLRG
ncbi:hypothetical protein QYE76_015496 [Lolium multiflorum]|uniref:Myb/SANT-like domain-containing protein n=1 Tax=Lolium multiflorum TaxID=4521 RepID=A0AAD8U6P4_LOLMU|nr:hypothetical protein QYE76_015496 [Lolium multiflorum]